QPIDDVEPPPRGAFQIRCGKDGGESGSAVFDLDAHDAVRAIDAERDRLPFPASAVLHAVGDQLRHDDAEIDQHLGRHHTEQLIESLPGLPWSPWAEWKDAGEVHCSPWIGTF